jgi:hypothetical protein
VIETAIRHFHGILRLLISAPLVACGEEPLENSLESRVPADRDIPIITNGAVPDAGWALARLNNGRCFSSTSFVYPETTTPVRLYLIDTGVAHADTWFSQNPKLQSFKSVLIRGSGDPTTSSAVVHGTQMLSLIAGPGTGAALGTPLHVVNFNIYPGAEGSPSSSGLLETAILEAIDDHTAQPGFRSVICIANGSNGEAHSPLLEATIDEAVAAGMPVIVSAGNKGANAANYIPAAYGTKDGVICVGASDATNAKLSSSNSGPAVDLYAPGQNVRTVNAGDPHGAFAAASGTSPATALSAAAALIHLSLDPSLTPAALETLLTTTAYAAEPAAAAMALVQVQPDPEGDSDLDGTSDLMETFFGSNPADGTKKPVPMAISRVSGQAQLSFNVSSDLFDPANPLVLADGATWKARISHNLTDWQDATGTLTPGAPADGVIPMVFSVPNAGGTCFMRIEVTPAP